MKHQFQRGKSSDLLPGVAVLLLSLLSVQVRCVAFWYGFVVLFPAIARTFFCTRCSRIFLTLLCNTADAKQKQQWRCSNWRLYHSANFTCTPELQLSVYNSTWNVFRKLQLEHLLFHRPNWIHSFSIEVTNSYSIVGEKIKRKNELYVLAHFTVNKKWKYLQKPLWLRARCICQTIQ